MTRHCDVPGAPPRPLQVFASNRVAYLYLLEGPSGVYVGFTTNPKARQWQHRWHARKPSGGQPVHVAMRADGPDSWAFIVVGCSYNNNAFGREYERQMVNQLRAEGRNVFNVDQLENSRRSAAKRVAKRRAHEAALHEHIRSGLHPRTSPVNSSALIAAQGCR